MANIKFATSSLRSSTVGALKTVRGIEYTVGASRVILRKTKRALRLSRNTQIRQALKHQSFDLAA